MVGTMAPPVEDRHSPIANQAALGDFRHPQALARHRLHRIAPKLGTMHGERDYLTQPRLVVGLESLTMTRPLLITRDALDEIRAWQEREARPASVFRVDVRLGGCRGFKLFFDLEETAQPDDVVSDFDGVKVVVQEDGLPLVAGSILDFEDSYRGRGFRLANPRARNACGCGTSFMADYPGSDSPGSDLDGNSAQIVAEAGVFD